MLDARARLATRRSIRFSLLAREIFCKKYSAMSSKTAIPKSTRSTRSARLNSRSFRNKATGGANSLAITSDAAIARRHYTRDQASRRHGASREIMTRYTRPRRCETLDRWQLVSSAIIANFSATLNSEGAFIPVARHREFSLSRVHAASSFGVVRPVEAGNRRSSNKTNETKERRGGRTEEGRARTTGKGRLT